MKTRLFKVFAVLAVLVVLTSVIATTGALASTDHESRFTGRIQSLPTNGSLIGDWQVGGRTVHVTAATSIDQEHGPVVVGAKVLIEGFKQSNGSYDAASADIRYSRDRSSK